MTPGLASLIDQVGPAQVLEHQDALWRLIYTRGYVDLDAARPTIDRVYAGLLVFAGSLRDGRTILVVDTAQRLVGAAGKFNGVPPVGSAVRLTGTFDGQATWKLLADEPFRLAASVDFAPASGVPDERWIAILRDALGEIAAHETAHRETIAARRRAIPPLGSADPVDELVRARSEAIRRDVEHATDYTAAERARLEGARRARQARSEAERRRGAALERELAQTRSARFETMLGLRMRELRDEIPALRERAHQLTATHAAIRTALERLESAHAESRARSAAVFSALAALDACAGASFRLHGLHAPPAGLDDPRRAHDVLRAIALLARALPRHRERVAV
jgi:hypothetical protein